MERFPREQGPAPTTRRKQWREGLLKLRGCMCPECRALSPARQLAWERHVRDVQRLMSRSAGKKAI